LTGPSLIGVTQGRELAEFHTVVGATGRAVQSPQRSGRPFFNSEFFRGRSAALSRLIESRSTDQRSGIRLVYQTLFCRPPSESELRAAEDFLGETSTADQGWPELCHALINLNEMLYLD
jgi:hypothetical protein